VKNKAKNMVATLLLDYFALFLKNTCEYVTNI